jgi:hypothetical protein
MSEVAGIAARANEAGYCAASRFAAEFPNCPDLELKKRAAFQSARADYLEAALAQLIQTAENPDHGPTPNPAIQYGGLDVHVCKAWLGAAPIFIEYTSWVDDGARFADIPAIWLHGRRFSTADEHGHDVFSDGQMQLWRDAAVRDYRSAHRSGPEPRAYVPDSVLGDLARANRLAA